MNILKRIWDQLNIIGQCKKSGLSIWQCPQFLFLIMGIIIFGTTLSSYTLGARIIDDPETVALIVIIIASVLLIIAFIITRSFEKLVEASRLKSEFVNIVSHQLRSPLTNIKWTFEALSATTDIKPEKREEYYVNVKENINRMVELIDDLLVVSKIEEDAFTVHKKEFVIDDLINSLVSRYKIFAKSSDINLIFTPDPEISKLIADSSMIKLVVENLIDNAIRYTKGGGKIEVKIQKKGKEVLFSVQDEGVGIPEKEKKFIFQKFFRAENALRSRTRGSGLGLYVCKSIVNASGGKIWFKSVENKGTTIFFTIPI